MEDVKKEKFGSRKSILKPLLVKNNIEFIDTLWFVTCRKAINSDENSRYLVIIEGNYTEIYSNILNKLNPNISVINAIFNENKKTVLVNNIKTGERGILTYDKFKNRIIELTKCKYIDSQAIGSSESTPLSRFFRENMGKGFALTDIDFYITSKKLFLEEKNFVHGNIGYIGIGQCISFKEIVNDVFPGIELKIVCIYNDKYYIGDINNINCKNSKTISGWGKMVALNLKEVSFEKLIKKLTT